jgi:hypothetical protein
MGRTVTHRPRNVLVAELPEPLGSAVRNATARMVSGIDPSFPVFGTPTTESVRNNFQAAKDDIEDLQATKLGLDGGDLHGQLLIDTDGFYPLVMTASTPVDVFAMFLNGVLNKRWQLGQRSDGVFMLAADNDARLTVDDANNLTTVHTDLKANGLLTLADDPNADLQAATKRYVDAALSALRDAFVVNVIHLGAVGDNVADDQPAFRAAIQSANALGLQTVVAPATPTGYRLGDGLVLEGNVILVGNLRGGGSPVAGFGTTLNFDNGVATCVTLDGGTGNLAQGLKYLTVLRSGGTPPPGSVGVFITSSYNVVVEDVTSFNHAKPWRWYANGVTGLSTMATRIFSGAATDVHVEIDSWPELRFSQCRFGRNGVGDYDCNAYVRITGGQPDPATDPGIGPNTIHFDNCHFNQGQNRPERWVTFDNMAGGGYTATIFSFRGCHVEACNAGIGGNINTGVIYNLSVAEVIYNTPGEFLDFHPNTEISQMRIVDCFLSGNLTITPTTGIYALKITSSVIAGATTLNGGTGSTADLVGNTYQGGLSLAGNWGSLDVLGGYGVVTCTATGAFTVFMAPDNIFTNEAAAGDPRGVKAIDFQALRFASDQCASGPWSVIIGGDQNTASGDHAIVAAGQASTANGAFSWVPGGSQAMTRGNYGRGAWASGSFASTGDAQAGELVLRGQTVGAELKNLTSDGGGPTPFNIVTLADNCTMTVRCMVTARDTTTGNSAGWDVVSVVKRGVGAGTVAIVGAQIGNQTPDWADAALTTLGVSMPPDTVNGGLLVQGIGIAGANLNWVVRVMICEVAG